MPTRVLLAEDSPTMRTLLVAALGADPDLQVVGEAHNGEQAVEMTRRLRPDVVVMDIHMPVLDGIEATRRIMQETPTPIVIVSGSANVREVGVAMRALEAGALTLVAKPRGVGATNFEAEWNGLCNTVKAMAKVAVVRRWPRREAPVAPPPPRVQPRPPPRVIGMAASTGGPAALAAILGELPADLPVPVLIVQHIAHGFVQGFATWLDTAGPIRVRIAQADEPALAGVAYLAPDDVHLTLDDGMRIHLDRSGPVRGFRPSADRLFQGLAHTCGPAAIGVILTGMGSDGIEGLRVLRAAGGLVVAQDEATSVVFGMPAVAIAAGLVDEVLPLPEIGAHLRRLAARTPRVRSQG